MSASSAALSALFHSADEARRLQGRWVDQLGFGAEQLPSRVVWRSATVELRAYQPAAGSGPALLIVPAPIKAPYIWDLAPGASAVERFLHAGLQVYLMAWQCPREEDAGLGLAHYADRAIRGCVQEIERETRQAQSIIAGHSLGGTLAAIFASLYPERVRGLIEFEGPMHFERDAGRLEQAFAEAPPGQVAVAVRNLPGTFLDIASIWADARTFHDEPVADWLQSSLSPRALQLHWRVWRWTLDECPMTRQLFEDVGATLYRDNCFAAGRLRVNGRAADPRGINAPIIAVAHPRSRIVPPVSIDAYRTATGSRDVQILEYEDEAGVMLQHVGVLVGPNAHRALWPLILQWVGRHAAGG